MPRTLLLAIGALWLATALIILAAPLAFYRLVPGLAETGPLNPHLLNDVGLAFLASGGLTLAGALRRQRALAAAGAAWPFLHALFHVDIWVSRGFAADLISVSDALVVLAPATAALIAAWRLRPPAASR